MSRYRHAIDILNLHAIDQLSSNSWHNCNSTFESTSGKSQVHVQSVAQQAQLHCPNLAHY